METSTNTVVGQPSGSSGTTPITCFNTALYYHFAFTDTFGDAVCCAYGQGSYNLQLDGLTVNAGENFYFLEEVKFKPESMKTDVELKFIYQMDYWPENTKWSLASNVDGTMGRQPYNTYIQAKKQV
jgi:hypothetical protein